MKRLTLLASVVLAVMMFLPQVVLGQAVTEKAGQKSLAPKVKQQAVLVRLKTELPPELKRMEKNAAPVTFKERLTIKETFDEKYFEDLKEHFDRNMFFLLDCVEFMRVGLEVPQLVEAVRDSAQVRELLVKQPILITLCGIKPEMVEVLQDEEQVRQLLDAIK